MIRGNIDLSFVTNSMLDSTVFAEENHVDYANGIWSELGVAQPQYPANSAVVYQSFNESCPDWAQEIKSKFDGFLKYSTVTINKVLPGNFIPPHRDGFYKLREFTKDFDVAGLELVRINIMLQDKKIGHVLELEGEVLNNYRRGDYVYIFPGRLHLVANVGFEPRYTCQVSGFATRQDLGL